MTVRQSLRFGNEKVRLKIKFVLLQSTVNALQMRGLNKNKRSQDLPDNPNLPIKSLPIEESFFDDFHKTLA